MRAAPEALLKRVVPARKLGALLLGMLWSLWSGETSAVASEMQAVGAFRIDRTEVSIGAFRQFAEATGFVSRAEVEGGGFEFGAGWERRPGWTWREPHGVPADDREPAVHLNHAEAEAYCHWAGKRLPTTEEWDQAAYQEMRPDPPPPFRPGALYDFPTGDTPEGANCLRDCGPSLSVEHGVRLERGEGHALAGTSRVGVNGLYDMGANVWEWIQTEGSSATTRGGSWWYGSGPMRRGHQAMKPKSFYAIYIGFRCVADAQ